MKHLKPSLVSIGVVLIFNQIGGTAAQEAAPPTRAESVAAELRDVELRNKAHIEKTDRQQREADSKVGNATSGVHFTATNGQSEVELRLTRDLGTLNVGGTKPRESISIALKAPAQKKADATTLASLDGLANGSRIEFSYASGILKGLKPLTKWDEVDKVCADMFAIYKQNAKSDAFLNIKPDDVQHKDGRPKCGRDIATIYEDTNDAALKNLAKSLRQLLQPINENAQLHTWGATATVGYDDFTYYDPTTLAKSDTRKHPWSVGTFYSMVMMADASRFSVSATVENAYKAAKAGTRCPAASGVQAAICVNGGFAAPEEKRAHVLSAGYRKILESGKYAWALTVNRDTRNKVTGVELPLYFLRSDEGFVNGGVTLGWNSEEKKTSFGLFIGKPFALF